MGGTDVTDDVTGIAVCGTEVVGNWTTMQWLHLRKKWVRLIGHRLRML